ncbi:RidA family protein [Candidatus Saccharibacteria bacterium]|nr:RidA family protein [Candidatus Saccharibacteria bacterium]
MKKTVETNKAPAAVGPYSQAVWVGDTLYCSGQIGIDPAIGKLVEGGVEMQTAQIFRNIAAVLDAAGLSFDNVVKTAAFLTDINDYAVVNEAYKANFTADFPARSAVAVSALPAGALVEIEVIATR